MRTRDLIWDSGAVLNQLACQFIYICACHFVGFVIYLGKMITGTVVGRHTDIKYLPKFIYVFMY